MKILVSPAAKRDLVKIARYVAVNAEDETAGRVVLRGLMRKIGALGIFPNRGSSVAGRLGIVTEYRYLVWRKYLIFYVVANDVVKVVRVADGRTDWVGELFGGE